ncbi:MAG: glycosyltransferase [Candidatus Micrarchaeota archaeon]|nr:glycosyltransferase [Candidatus Micrarchaeota archaeon]
MPAYNEEKYIGACLASIKRQKFTEKYEIIIGDGGSTDNTQKIARDYGARVIEEKYGTPSGGRYAASKVAKGKIFFFVSADVELGRGCMQNTYDAFSDRKVTWALGGVAPLEGNWLEKFGALILNLIAGIFNPIGIAYVNADNLSARADAYRKVGGFNPKLVTSEDTDLGIRLMKSGRFKFAWKATTLLSMRRVRNWGYLRFAMFHTTNFFSTHLFSSAAQRYDPVR